MSDRDDIETRDTSVKVKTQKPEEQVGPIDFRWVEYGSDNPNKIIVKFPVLQIRRATAFIDGRLEWGDWTDVPTVTVKV